MPDNANTIFEEEVPDHDELIDSEFIKRALPVKLPPKRREQIAEQVNLICESPEMRDVYKDNMIGYASVLKEGNFQVSAYLNAVKFVTYKMQNISNTKAWMNTFSERVETIKKKYPPNKVTATCSQYASSYAYTKLVRAIMDQLVIPTHIVNMDLFQEAINTQAKLMRDDSISPKVRSDAAHSLITTLKPPEVARLELEVKQSSEGKKMMQDFNDTMRMMAETQRQALTKGYTLDDIRMQDVIVIPEEDVKVLTDE